MDNASMVNSGAPPPDAIHSFIATLDTEIAKFVDMAQQGRSSIEELENHKNQSTPREFQMAVDKIMKDVEDLVACLCALYESAETLCVELCCGGGHAGRITTVPCEVGVRAVRQQ